jgi:Flp pilus assembly pilin Flp
LQTREIELQNVVIGLSATDEQHGIHTNNFSAGELLLGADKTLVRPPVTLFGPRYLGLFTQRVGAIVLMVDRPIRWYYQFEAVVLHVQKCREREKLMKLIWKLRLMKDARGQDLIEYALMAGFVAVAAGAIMPGVAAQITTIFGKVSSALALAGS